MLKDKKSVFIDKRVRIGKNVIIYENNRIEGTSIIEDNVTIFPNCYISNSIIGKGSKIYTSVIENSKIGKCSAVGPFSHIKKTIFGEHSKIGAFSELKNSEITPSSVIGPGSIVFENKFLNNKNDK